MIATSGFLRNSFSVGPRWGSLVLPHERKVVFLFFLPHGVYNVVTFCALVEGTLVLELFSLLVTSACGHFDRCVSDVERL